MNIQRKNRSRNMYVCMYIKLENKCKNQNIIYRFIHSKVDFIWDFAPVFYLKFSYLWQFAEHFLETLIIAWNLSTKSGLIQNRCALLIHGELWRLPYGIFNVGFIPWLADKVADMAQKLAQLLTQSEIYMYLYPWNVW